MIDASNPLTGPIPKEIPLPEAPLVRVISQIRFPLQISIEKRENIGPFQEALKDQYPIFRPERSQGIVVSPGGILPTQNESIWRFSSLKGDWRVSLSPEFLALETTAYQSRKDFISRLSLILESLTNHLNPGVYERLGLRYIDRIKSPFVEDIAKLIRPEVLGILGTPLREQAQSAVSESIFEMLEEKKQLRARWGFLGKGTTIDPDAIDPINEPSWVLDVDLFSSEPRQFNPQGIAKEVEGYAERIYAFFRWMVNKNFLTSFGAKL